MKTVLIPSFGLKWRGRRSRGGEGQFTPAGLLFILIIFLSLAAVGTANGQGAGISETEITPDASSILELRSTLKGFLVPRMTTAQRMAIVSPAQGLMVFDTDTQSFWYYDSGWKVIASTSLGSANQLLGMNAGASANEYKTLDAPQGNITVSHAPGSISLNTAQDIQTTSSPVFNALELSGLTPNSGVYTDGSSTLTTAPPSSGVAGYWNRNNTLLTPSNSGDNISTTGSVTAGSIVKSGGLASEFLKADGSVDNNTYLQGNEIITFASTGDVTGTATGATSLAPALTIADGAVTLAKIADNAITSAKILDGTIANADVAATAAIDGTKISPDFGSQAVATTGAMSAGSATVAGNIAVGGTVDGRDVAQDGTYQDNMQALTGVAAGSAGLGTFGGTVISDNATIKSALQELETSIVSQTDSDDQTAAEVEFTPAGNISSGNVQAAITELDAEKLSLTGGTMSGDIGMAANNITGAGTITAGTIVKSGGQASEFLKADGSVDNSTYLQGNEIITFASTGDVTGTATGATSLVPSLTIANGAVTSAKILDGTIVNADVAATAAIDGTKISPDFGSQAVATTGAMSAGSATVAGNIAVGGTVDGRDVAQDGTYQDNMQTLTGVAAGSADLGTFGGAVISDNATIKSALQELEAGVEAAPSLNYTQSYLGADMDLLNYAWSGPLMSVTLAPGVWMITASVVVKAQHVAQQPMTWDTQVVLGSALSTAFVSGRNSVYAEGVPESYTTINLSSAISLSTQTTISLFAIASVDAEVAGMLSLNGNTVLATQISAVRIQ